MAREKRYTKTIQVMIDPDTYARLEDLGNGKGTSATVRDLLSVISGSDEATVRRLLDSHQKLLAQQQELAAGIEKAHALLARTADHYEHCKRTYIDMQAASKAYQIGAKGPGIHMVQLPIAASKAGK